MKKQNTNQTKKQKKNKKIKHQTEKIKIRQKIKTNKKRSYCYSFSKHFCPQPKYPLGTQAVGKNQQKKQKMLKKIASFKLKMGKLFKKS